MLKKKLINFLSFSTVLVDDTMHVLITARTVNPRVKINNGKPI